MEASGKDYSWACSQPEIVYHLLKTALYVSLDVFTWEKPGVDLSAILENKKGIKAMDKLLESLTTQLIDSLTELPVKACTI